MRNNERRNYSFFKIPMVFVEDDRYKEMSVEAKYLYGLMLNRVNLSAKNKWYDQNNEVYIIFTLQEIGEVVGCKNEKAIKILVELERYSLIRRKRQGLGKPTMIYVEDFIDTESYPTNGNEPQNDDILEDNSETCENTTDINNSDDIGWFDEYEPDLSDYENPNEQTENLNQDIDKSESEYPNFGCAEFRESESSKINNNKINYSYIDINQSNLSRSKDKIEEIDVYKKTIQKNIEYDYLLKNSSLTDKGLVDELYETMCDIVCANGGEVRINGHNYPIESVKSRFLKITQSHIEYAIESIKKVTGKIYNIKSYLTTVLFNAPTTMNHYYSYVY